MAIHYIGELQRTPGRRACDAVSGQADARSWHATDCSACLDTLIGLRVRWIGTDPIRGTIAQRHGQRVIVHFGESGADGPNLFELENSREADR